MIFMTKKDGKPMLTCYIENQKDLPSREIRDSMRAAGYKLYLDGKIFKESPKRKRND